MRIFLFLDYDGTLVPLAQKPSEAVLSGETISLLHNLVHSSHIRVAIVSGRALDTLRDLIPISGLYLAACHGGVIQLPAGDRYYLKGLPDTQALNNLAGEVKTLLDGRHGYVLEFKELGLAFHYRQVSELESGRILPVVRGLFLQYCPEPHWELVNGKKVLEVRPSGVNKGSAVLHLLNQWPGAFPLFAGDDLTDEDAFRALSGRGRTILVTDKRCSTAAAQQMTRQELLLFLRRIEKNPAAALTG